MKLGTMVHAGWRFIAARLREADLRLLANSIQWKGWA